MLNIVRQHVPDTWTDESAAIVSSSSEYFNIRDEVSHAIKSGHSLEIEAMIRGQDLHSYGQFLVREQLLINSDSQQLYRVRRYVQVNPISFHQIFKYNLDPRRCDLPENLTFTKNLNNLDYNKLIVVVQVLTRKPFADTIEPNTSSDYYVEYVLVLKN